MSECALRLLNLCEGMEGAGAGGAVDLSSQRAHDLGLLLIG